MHLISGECKAVDALLHNTEVHAVAGIGNPQRFFETLQGLGYKLQTHAFDDHHAFKKQDLPSNDGKVIIMTEKDAVKCAQIADERCWYLEVDAQLDADFVTLLQRQLKDLSGLKKHRRELGAYRT